jgi:hypothetical protein
LTPLWVAAVAGVARADDPPTTLSAQAAAFRESGLDDGFHATDSHGDRVVLLPTAKTQPKGAFTVSSYDIVLVQAGYALTDATQLTLTFTPPIEGTVPLDLSLKTAFVREPLVRVAAQLSASGVSGLRDLGFVFLGRGGLVGDFCFRSTCASSITVASNLTFAGPLLLLWNGVGAIWRVAPRLALLVEADTLIPLGRVLGEANGVLGWAGLRVPGRAWSFDATLGYTPQAEPDSRWLPLLVLSYRPGT